MKRFKLRKTDGICTCGGGFEDTQQLEERPEKGQGKNTEDWI